MQSILLLYNRGMRHAKAIGLLMFYNAVGIILLLTCMHLIHTTDSVLLTGLYGILYWFLLVAVLGVMTKVDISMIAFANMVVLAFSIFFEPLLDTRASALLTNERAENISVRDIYRYPEANIFHLNDGYTDTSFTYFSRRNESSTHPRYGNLSWRESRKVIPVFPDNFSEGDSIQLWICTFESTAITEEEWSSEDWSSIKSGYTLHSLPEAERREIELLVVSAANYFALPSSRSAKIIRLSRNPEWEYVEGVVIFVSVIATINLILLVLLQIKYGGKD